MPQLPLEKRRPRGLRGPRHCSTRHFWKAIFHDTEVARQRDLNYSQTCSELGLASEVLAHSAVPPQARSTASHSLNFATHCFSHPQERLALALEIVQVELAVMHLHQLVVPQATSCSHSDAHDLEMGQLHSPQQRRNLLYQLVVLNGAPHAFQTIELVHSNDRVASSSCAFCHGTDLSPASNCPCSAWRALTLQTHLRWTLPKCEFFAATPLTQAPQNGHVFEPPRM
mmetsp:Transcript_122855/g.192848  ORF Transcript_122855/g.192848 Transcript_122855/m.192848 type:complete len:227 (-) Transcript_122855:1240-1920(-)